MYLNITAGALENGTRHNENAIKYLLGVTATCGFFSLCLCVSWLEAREISFSLDKNSPSESNYKGPHPNVNITVRYKVSESGAWMRYLLLALRQTIPAQCQRNFLWRVPINIES